MLMAIMGMVTALKPNKHFWLFSLSLFLSPVFAGEWTFDPSISTNETYTDNVKLNKNNPISSYVNQTTLGIDSTFKSRKFEFSLQNENIYASYSHDHSIDKGFRTLTTKARYNLWTSGPAIIGSVTIANRSRNAANNGLADLVSGNTVETRTYQTGIEYNLTNSHYKLASSLLYNKLNAGDSIGNRHGYAAVIKANNGTVSHLLLWQFNGRYVEQKNNGFSGRIRNIEALAGVITPVYFSPFIRWFNEDSTGNIAGNQNLGTSSWGPGVRWRLSSHFYVDLSYNYVADKSKSSNYVATAINWQPSSRTTLEASYNKRFFGNSYHLKFEHKIRRLTNNISYDEKVQAFDRNSYKRVNLGNFWCPIGADISTDVTSCFVRDQSNIDVNNYRLVSIFDQVLVPGNEFSLNKTLSWRTTLTLARTIFSFRANSLKRESLTTNRVEKSFNSSVSASRKISGKSDLKLTFNFRRQQFDTSNIDGVGQSDYYKILTTTYTRKLSKKLSSNFSVQYLHRHSSVNALTYNETRAIITVKKEF